MANIGELTAVLGVDTQGLDRAAQEFKQFSSSLSGSEKILTSFSSSVSRLGATAQEIVGDLTVVDRAAQSVSDTFKGLLGPLVAIVTAWASIAGLKSQMLSGVRAAEDFKLTIISIASTFADMEEGDPTANFRRGLGEAETAYQKLAEVEKRHYVTAKDLLTAYEIMLQHGVKVREEEMEYLAVIADKIKITTKGQAFEIQLAQELHGLLEGQVRVGSRLASIIKNRLGSEWQEILQREKEAGNYLKFVAGLFPGLSAAVAEIENTFEAQGTTLQSILKYIGREGMLGLHHDSVELLKEVNYWLGQNKKAIAEKILISYWAVKDVLTSIYDITRSIIDKHADWAESLANLVIPDGLTQGLVDALETVPPLISDIVADLKVYYEEFRRFIDTVRYSVTVPFSMAYDEVGGLEGIIQAVKEQFDSLLATIESVATYLSDRFAAAFEQLGIGQEVIKSVSGAFDWLYETIQRVRDILASLIEMLSRKIVVVFEVVGLDAVMQGLRAAANLSTDIAKWTGLASKPTEEQIKAYEERQKKLQSEIDKAVEQAAQARNAPAPPPAGVSLRDVTEKATREAMKRRLAGIPKGSALDLAAGMGLLGPEAMTGAGVKSTNIPVDLSRPTPKATGGGEGGGTKEAENALKRLENLTLAWEQEITRLTGTGMAQLDSWYAKELKQIEDLEEKGADGTAARAALDELYDAKKRKLVTDYNNWVAQNTGDMYAVLRFQMEEHIRQWGDTEERKNKITEIYAGKRTAYEAEQRAKSLGFQRDSLKALEEMTVYLDEQFQYKARILEIEKQIAIEGLKRELNEGKLTKDMYEQGLAMQALVFQAKQFELMRQSWAKEGVFGGVQMWAFERIGDMQTRMAKETVEAIKSAESALTDTLSKAIINAFEGKKQDLVGIYTQIMEYSVRRGVSMAVGALFDVFAVAIGVPGMVKPDGSATKPFHVVVMNQPFGLFGGVPALTKGGLGVLGSGGLSPDETSDVINAQSELVKGVSAFYGNQSGFFSTLTGQTMSWGDTLWKTVVSFFDFIKRAIISAVNAVSGLFGGGPLFGGGAAAGNISSGAMSVFSGLMPMQSGGVIVGERGPEAIFPLVRTSKGDLGIAAIGGGGGDVKLDIRVVNNLGVPADANVRQTGDSIEILLNKAVSNSIKSGGPVFSAIQQAFHVTPRVARR